MGNSHGSNAATSGRIASTQAQQTSQQAAPTNANATARSASGTVSEATAQRGVAVTQRAYGRALAAANRLQQRANEAQQRARQLQHLQWDYQAAQAHHDAQVRAAIRAGRTSAPDLVRQLEEARTQRQESITNGRALMRAAQRAQQAADRAPEDRAAQRALRDAQHALSRAQLATGRLAVTEGQIEQRLIRATGGVDLQTQITRAEAAARAADAQYVGARGRLQQASEDLQFARSQLDIARGGTGVLATNSPSEQQALAEAATLFNRNLTVADFGRMLGARAGESVAVRSNSPGEVSVGYSGAHRTASMSFSRVGGKLEAHVGWAGNEHGQRTAASGRDLLRAMQAMRDMGVQQVTATAGGSGSARFGQRGSMNGYYTWARMGFTGTLPSSVRGAARARFGASVRTVQDVMRKKGGPAWWKQNGDQFDATFSWSNPYSVATFERLLAAANRGGNA